MRELIREVIKETGYYSGVPGVGKEHNDTIRFTQSFNGDELKNYLEKRYGKDSLRAKANFSAWLLLTDDGKKFLEANKNTLDRDYIDNSQKILTMLKKMVDEFGLIPFTRTNGIKFGIEKVFGHK